MQRSGAGMRCGRWSGFDGSLRAGLVDSMTVYAKDRTGIRLTCDEKPVLSGGMETYVFLDK